ncbi:LysR family transcriptional regulator, glycine cleavage system transcriptional activator [Tranquillimonas rosea]|uniref:LysR family transcriptional regulator, glycine cleavage system transcriptional activator n=1 Tax=Tranquillimonas rosea TaxID=641238 RepID=A0A1H9UE04_9RHOB|nr:LysR family transcriptional regulator [Tranquillimonas rosea]SES07582.1 LysR family transcriptional regulator, glycine cleavage system transcriptional activator [Tranquillimonas rosea]
MDWRTFPSLSALRAFEAASRTGSLSAAARELNVTHAAVAQHLRTLSERFGRALMVREGQGMALTDDGRVLAEAVRDGFSRIEAGLAELTDRSADRPLRVTLTPTFAEAWLMPRIGEFWSRHPEIELSLVPSMEVMDLRREGFDLAIRFGDGSWPGLEVSPLVQGPFVVVGAPSLVRGRNIKEMGPLDSYAWYLSRASREQTVWGASLGLDFTQMAATEMPDNGLALSAVRAGYGLSIQARALVERDLEAGALQSVYEGESQGLGYFLVTQKGVPSERLAILLKWLRRAARRS